jgi:hypothetical protein
MPRRVCGACGTRNGLSEVFCTRCGAALKRKHRPPLRLAGKGGAFLQLFPGLTQASVAACAAAALVLAGGLGYLTVHLLQADAVPPSILTGVLAMVFYCTGLTWLLYGYVCVPTQAVVEFDGRRWLVVLGLSLAPIVILAGLVGA